MDNNRIKRRYSPYSFNSWESFHNPLGTEEKLAEFSNQFNPHNDPELSGILQEFRRKLAKTRVQYLLQKHTKFEPGQEVGYKSLHNFFRAFAVKVLPQKLLGSVRNVQTFAENCCILFSAGKGTSLFPSDLLAKINMNDLKWSSNSEGNKA